MKKKSNVSKSTLDPARVLRDREVPATQGMLSLVRTELKSKMKAGFRHMDSKFNQIDARFSAMESKFSQVDSRFAQIDSRFAQMDSKFEQVLSEVARVGVLVEEQNSRNQVVLEGLTGLFHRQDRVEVRLGETEALLQIIGSRSRPSAPK